MVRESSSTRPWKSQRRPGWSVQRGALAFNYSSGTNFTKGFEPAVLKVAFAMLLDPEATFADLAAAYQRIDGAELSAARARLQQQVITG